MSSAGAENTMPDIMPRMPKLQQSLSSKLPLLGEAADLQITWPCNDAAGSVVICTASYVTKRNISLVSAGKYPLSYPLSHPSMLVGRHLKSRKTMKINEKRWKTIKNKGK
jgi:hypothetical protein